MVWFIEGSPLGINFHVNEDGLSLSGTALKHEPNQPGDEFDRDMDRRFEFDRAFFGRIQSLPFHWSIHERNGTNQKGALWGKELSEELNRRPDGSIAAISLLGDPECLGCGIFLPRNKFQPIWNLCQGSSGTMRFSYLITIDFVGFPLPEVQVQLPTISAFRTGQPYVSNFTGFTLKPASDA